MVLALLLALLVRVPFKGVGFIRTIILIPTVTSMVVVSVIWGLMYHPNSGLINGILETLSLPTQKFLIDTGQAMPSLVVMTIWKDVGFNMIFFLAGLLSIPGSYYEAAMLDGANRWQLFRHITIPLLRGTTVFVLITSMISAFKVFTPVFLMTKGGPSSVTRVIVLYIYENAFIFNKMGYAAAISVILALILLIASVIQIYFRSRS
ncbi:MAG: sugar ABC transporter permease [Chloroflexi bacterium]|nr:MAG: sugar ABC transporter permease [Chloroflexota bacterium]MBL1196441.1 sugar ABC transporter permease [Chloroflexota bacterium]NOH13736.1 sugar ABC transporter permease [Chloroflexota bacterium]